MSRNLILMLLVVAGILYGIGVDTIIICVVFMVSCLAIMLCIGFPTQKKLSEYEQQLKKFRED